MDARRRDSSESGSGFSSRNNTHTMSSPNSSAPSVSAGITVNLLELVEAFPNYEVG